MDKYYTRRKEVPLLANMISELKSIRSQTTKHFLNDDGTRTALISHTPVHYKDTDNKYQDIDLTIIPEVNWEFKYSVKKNNFRAYFDDSTDILNPTLASFELVNSNGVSRWVNYKLLNANPSGVSYEGNKFKYKDVSPNTDLEYEVTPIQLKENIIVKVPVESVYYTFTLKLDPMLLMEQQLNGSILFIDTETLEQLWKIDAPYAFDSNPNNVLKTNNVSQILGKETYNGIEYDTITVSCDDLEFLTNSIYPVIIDPTTSYGTTIATSGTTTTGGTGTWGNNGALRYWYDGTNWMQTQWSWSFQCPYQWMQTVSGAVFDTSGLPDNCVISSAQLKFDTVQLLRSYPPNWSSANQYLYAGWWTGGMDTSIFIDGVDGSAGSMVDSSITTLNNAMNLINLSNINKTGVTKLRFTANYPAYYSNAEWQFNLMMKYSANFSLAVTYTIPQSAPATPVASSIGTNSMVWTSTAGSRIVCNGQDLPSGSTWSGLAINTQYSAYAYMPASGDYSQSPNSATAYATTIKLNQSAPTTPVASSITSSSVVFTSTAGSSIVFNGLTKVSGSSWALASYTTYAGAYAYMPADATHYQSPNSGTSSSVLTKAVLPSTLSLHSLALAMNRVSWGCLNDVKPTGYVGKLSIKDILNYIV